MNRLILMLPILLLLPACGGSGGGDSSPTPITRSCSNLDERGTWYNSSSTTDTLVVSDNCTLTGSYCDHTMTFTLPDESTFETIVTIHTANLNAGCMQPAVYDCEVGILTDGRLGIDCGTTNQFIYQRTQ